MDLALLPLVFTDSFLHVTLRVLKLLHVLVNLDFDAFLADLCDGLLQLFQGIRLVLLHAFDSVVAVLLKLLLRHFVLGLCVLLQLCLLTERKAEAANKAEAAVGGRLIQL